ncbi:MAG: hypothetical protein OXT09_19390 [Myxococcales bacterium]|nr:hypothetical protein [Myxococcales bacterium]
MAILVDQVLGHDAVGGAPDAASVAGRGVDFDRLEALAQLSPQGLETLALADRVGGEALAGRAEEVRITTVKPASATERAKLATSGVMPGISCITTTPGPCPRRKTVRATPSCSKRVCSKPSTPMRDLRYL